jgi:AbrB family looped-hinge helix DNA binding protein
MITIRIGNRGQITLPIEIRRQFGLREGDRIALVPQGEQVVMLPITQTLLDLRGSVTVTGPQDFSTIRKQILSGQFRDSSTDDT